MRAFPLKGIPENEWEKLVGSVKVELENLSEAQRTSSSPGERRQGKMRATLRLHPDTGLLVVLGQPPFLDTVASFVSAWQANVKRLPK
jgi:hypothetical protein